MLTNVLACCLWINFAWHDGVRVLHPPINRAQFEISSNWRLASHEARTAVAPPVSEVITGGANGKVIALTFDDGPHRGYTDQLVKILTAKQAPATFFVIGKQVDAHPDLVRLERDHGFAIGNHSYSHVMLTRVSLRQAITEFRACNVAVFQATGLEPTYARPPGGDMDTRVLRAASASNLTTVLWTNDPGDYSKPGVKVIVHRTLRHLTDGGIILLHDGVQETVDCLPDLIDRIRKRGFTIVPLSELRRKTT